MKCKKCGYEQEELLNFCPQCGYKIEQKQEMEKKEKPATVKKKSATVFAIAGLGVILIIAVAVLSWKVWDGEQAEKMRQHAALKQMQSVLESVDLDIDELLADESSKKEYKQLLKDLKEAIINCDVENGTLLTGKIEKKGQAMAAESRKIVSKKVDALQGVHTTSAYDAEVEQIEGFSEKVEQLVLEQKYVSALEVTTEWQGIIDFIEKKNNYLMSISQIDASEFPKVKLYLYIKNILDGTNLAISKADNFSLMEKINGAYIKKDIQSVTKLDEAEKLNINLVADISGSMEYQFDNVKSAMSAFAESIQFGVGDRASLITFDNNVSVDVDFTSQKQSLKASIFAMQLGNMTALYDALYVAISKTAMQNGAKCVVAFTDGYDNASVRTLEEVTELAQRYKIPIYIIGIGDQVDSIGLTDMAEKSGGFFEMVDTGVSMQPIYESIYRQQKELYLLEYETSQEKDSLSRSIYISYRDDIVAVRNEAIFTPSILNKVSSDYQQLIDRSSISNQDIEDEVLRIRAIWNADKEEMSKKRYDVTKVADGIKSYSNQGDIRMIEVSKNIGGISYARTYNFSGGKLIFAYIEAGDAHRLYFKNDKLFRWRYTQDAKKKENAVNHDNESDSDAFKQWEITTLKEAYRIYADALQKVQ